LPLKGFLFESYDTATRQKSWHTAKELLKSHDEMMSRGLVNCSGLVGLWSAFR
jgi:hypothetical protein